ncbi:MAG TPA: hypothetical protein VFW71_06920 [Actinomycetota bacterium]|nr:hypothetical protein [Actinomycetota bacterium]
MSDQPTDQPSRSKPEVSAAATRAALGPSVASIATRVASTVSTMVQKEGSAPIVENSGLPAMAARGADLSAATVAAVGNPALRLVPLKNAMGSLQLPTTGTLMAAVPTGAAPDAAAGGGARGDQAARPVARAAAPGESYVRMLISVSGSQVSVSHVAEVPGPLADPSPLHGGLAYEVTVGDRAIRVGSIPDPGVRRSFASEGAPEQFREHFFVETTDYEFTVRVPKQAIAAADLPSVHVAVLQLDPSQVIQPVGDKPLAAQFPNLVKELTRLPGIQAAALAEPVRTALTATFGTA